MTSSPLRFYKSKKRNSEFHIARAKEGPAVISASSSDTVCFTALPKASGVALAKLQVGICCKSVLGFKPEGRDIVK